MASFRLTVAAVTSACVPVVAAAVRTAWAAVSADWSVAWLPFVYSPGWVPSCVFARYHWAESIAADKLVVDGGENELPCLLQEGMTNARDNPNAIERVRYFI